MYIIAHDHLNFTSVKSGEVLHLANARYGTSPRITLYNLQRAAANIDNSNK